MTQCIYCPTFQFFWLMCMPNRHVMVLHHDFSLMPHGWLWRMPIGMACRASMTLPLPMLGTNLADGGPVPRVFAVPTSGVATPSRTVWVVPIYGYGVSSPPFSFEQNRKPIEMCECRMQAAGCCRGSTRVGKQGQVRLDWMSPVGKPACVGRFHGCLSVRLVNSADGNGHATPE